MVPVIIQKGLTALILAAMGNKTEVAALLIESGANTDIQDKVHDIIHMVHGSVHV